MNGQQRLLDLGVVIIFTGIAILLALANVNSLFLRVLFELPLIMVLPGYVLCVALFPQRDFPAYGRILLSLGLSIAVTVLGGLLLNLTPWGIQTTTWVFWLGGVTLGVTVLAALRRLSQPPSSISNDLAHTAWRFDLRAGSALLFGLAILLVSFALLITRAPAPPQGLEGYTQLWLLPDPNTKTAVRLGISSNEFETTNYKLELQLGGKELQEWTPIILKPGEDWETTVTLPKPVGSDTIEALLYRLDQPETVYRHGSLKANSGGQN